MGKCVVPTYCEQSKKMGERDIGFNNLWIMSVFYHEKLTVKQFQAILVTLYLLKSGVVTD